MPLPPEQYLKPEVIQQVSRLDLRAKFIVEGFIAGLHKSPFHGFSVEFSEHRKYVPGDDIRGIDWSVYAKTDRYYIKKFQAETNLEAYLLIDCSGSMDFATGKYMRKMDYAICLASALGHMMIRQQDPIGLFAFDEKIRRFLPPKSKRSHLIDMLTVLSRIKPFGQTNLSQTLHEVAARLKKRSLVILISDMLGDQESIIKGLHHLKHGGHDIIIFQIFDHAEANFDFDGQYFFTDPETNQQLKSDSSAVKKAYLNEIQEFIETYKNQCNAIRADFVPVVNSMTFDKALIEYLAQRSNRF